MMKQCTTPYVKRINASVIEAACARSLFTNEMVMVGEKRLIGEVVSVQDDCATIQVYEDTAGLRYRDAVIPTAEALSVALGPGILGGVFDGIERPLKKISELSGDFIGSGIGLIALDEEKQWDVTFLVKHAEEVHAGQIFAQVQETSAVVHHCMIPPGVHGVVARVCGNGKYTIAEPVLEVLQADGTVTSVSLMQRWPIRRPRPVLSRLEISKPLFTGQRVIDTFFPLAKGGTCAIPGGFGTGKTITQHQIAKWSDAQIIVYIGCGERGNEISEVLEDFPKLINPRTNASIMDNTILIANTSNMPVAAREASIYTGITIAEYYRDMGYDVAIMADSTSRWAEALREISGRLEEMPAEEGYPAYLPSRLAGFYERAGDVLALSGKEGSVSIIGAVSPSGGDMSEPVTVATKRVVSTFLALDKSLAYARHYPAINWLNSYSGYIDDLKAYYDDTLGEEFLLLRAKLLSILSEENKLQEIVKLVGEDILPDSQRLVLLIARVIKQGYLQQNAYHTLDAHVSAQKQLWMLRVIDTLYEKTTQCLKYSIGIDEIDQEGLFSEVIMMKYTIKEEEPEKFETLKEKIISVYDTLIYSHKKEHETYEASLS